MVSCQFAQSLTRANYTTSERRYTPFVASSGASEIYTQSTRIDHARCLFAYWLFPALALQRSVFRENLSKFLTFIARSVGGIFCETNEHSRSEITSNRQTDTHTHRLLHPGTRPKYRYPRCACAPRVNYLSHQSAHAQQKYFPLEIKRAEERVLWKVLFCWQGLRNGTTIQVLLQTPQWLFEVLQSILEGASMFDKTISTYYSYWSSVRQLVGASITQVIARELQEIEHYQYSLPLGGEIPSCLTGRCHNL